MNSTRPWITRPFSLRIVVHDIRAWTTKRYLEKFLRELFKRFRIIRACCTTPKTWRGFPIIHSMYPFSPLTTHITHDGGGFEQVGPLLILYKRSKSHSPEVSSTIHNFSSLCSREKTDLTVGGSLTKLYQSPLPVFSFLSGPKAITIA